MIERDVTVLALFKRAEFALVSLVPKLSNDVGSCVNTFTKFLLVYFMKGLKDINYGTLLIDED